MERPTTTELFICIKVIRNFSRTFSILAFPGSFDELVNLRKEELAQRGYQELASHFNLSFPPKPDDERFVFEKLNIRSFWTLHTAEHLLTVQLGFIAAWANMENTPMGDLALSGRFPESMDTARVAKLPKHRVTPWRPGLAPPIHAELETLIFERKTLVLGNRRYNCYWERVR